MSIERIERQDGEVVFRVRWRDHRGRNRARVLGRRRDAEAFEAEVKRRKRMGQLAAMDARRETLDVYVTGSWAKAHATHLGARTRLTYASSYDRHIAPPRRRAAARVRRRARRHVPGRPDPRGRRSTRRSEGHDAPRGTASTANPRAPRSCARRSARSSGRRARRSGSGRPLCAFGRPASCCDRRCGEAPRPGFEPGAYSLGGWGSGVNGGERTGHAEHKSPAQEVAEVSGRRQGIPPRSVPCTRHVPLGSPSFEAFLGRRPTWSTPSAKPDTPVNGSSTEPSEASREAVSVDGRGRRSYELWQVVLPATESRGRRLTGAPHGWRIV